MTVELVEDEVLKLESADLLKLELLRTKAALLTESSARRALQAEKLEREAAIKALELRNEKKIIDLKQKGAKADFDTFLTELGEKYSVDLRQATYDDETGIIYQLEDD